MKPDRIVTVVSSATLALLGWVVGCIATIRRDRLSRKRDLRTQYLLDAYRRLEGAGNRRRPSREDEKALESSVADIQLLGSREQVHLARQFVLEFADTGRASRDPLLEALRVELWFSGDAPRIRHKVCRHDTALCHNVRVRKRIILANYSRRGQFARLSEADLNRATC